MLSSSTLSRRPREYRAKSLMPPPEDSTTTSSRSFSGQRPAFTSYWSSYSDAVRGSLKNTSVFIMVEIRLLEEAEDVTPSAAKD